MLQPPADDEDDEDDDDDDDEEEDESDEESESSDGGGAKRRRRDAAAPPDVIREHVADDFTPFPAKVYKVRRGLFRPGSLRNHLRFTFWNRSAWAWATWNCRRWPDRRPDAPHPAVACRTNCSSRTASTWSTVWAKVGLERDRKRDCILELIFISFHFALQCSSGWANSRRGWCAPPP